VSLLDFINFLLAILFYILAKLEFQLVIFREALGVALIKEKIHDYYYVCIYRQNTGTVYRCRTKRVCKREWWWVVTTHGSDMSATRSSSALLGF
jgi:hypothetical protein